MVVCEVMWSQHVTTLNAINVVKGIEIETKVKHDKNLYQSGERRKLSVFAHLKMHFWKICYDDGYDNVSKILVIL